MTQTEIYEREWTELFSRKTFSEAVDEVVEMVWSNGGFGNGMLLVAFIMEKHWELWYGLPRYNSYELDEDGVPRKIELCDHFHHVVRGIIDNGLKSRFTCVQANFRRRHCLIKMIREMNEKCCRGTGFYSENY